MNPKYLMDTFNLVPKKSLGQNFLHDPNALEKIVATAEIKPGHNVIEVGPGTGALTIHLAQIASRVVAVEIDNRLIPVLQQQLRDYPNVEVIHADILETDVEQIMQGQDYIVVGNLPYYITSAILRHLLDKQHKPKRLVLTVQQEVAERLVAQPGDMSLLAVSVQYYGRPRIVSKLSPAVFWPRPDVESAVVRIDVYDTPPVDIPGEELFFQVVRAGFSQKRKQIKNSIGSGLGLSHPQTSLLLEGVGIDPARRAETLTLQEWAIVSWAVAKHQPASRLS